MKRIVSATMINLIIQKHVKTKRQLMIKNMTRKRRRKKRTSTTTLKMILSQSRQIIISMEYLVVSLQRKLFPL